MNNIFLYIKKIHNSMEKGRGRALQAHGITGPQLDLLEYLYYREEQSNTVTDIAAFFGVQHTSIIHIVKVLEKKELIFRKEEGTRCRPIFLTDEGIRIMKEVDHRKEVTDQTVFQGISKQEEEVLRTLLVKLYNNIESYNEKIQKENRK
ncbi:MAG: MarR family transcriptional regulator [Hespellia sp.]|nr:MarR family transcriptional regulator [Hespellia sp.]